MRTPMDPTEAEAALGSRGSTPIMKENVAMARRWLTAKGANSKYSNSCPYWLANKIYNDLSDAELNKYIATGNEWAAKKGHTETAGTVTAATSNANTSTVALETAHQDKEPVTISPPVNDGSAGATLANIIGPYLGNAVMTQVMDAVEKRLANVQTIRIEVARANGETATVEGHNHPMMKDLLTIMASRQVNGLHPNIMLCGPTGSGKTHAVHQAAKALGMEFFTNGALSMDHQLVGFIDAGGNYHQTPFRQAFVQPAVYLFDEIDSSDNTCLLALAGALANGNFHFPDAMVKRHPDSIIIAAGNTWGNGATSDFVGRNRLDGAIRSRFPVRLSWDYDEDLETAICGNPQWAARVQRARWKARQAGLKVIIDPRMSQAGAALVAQGMSFDRAAECTYLADLTKEQRDMIEAQ